MNEALCSKEDCPNTEFKEMCCHDCPDKDCLWRCDVAPDFEHCIYKNGATPQLNESWKTKPKAP